MMDRLHELKQRALKDFNQLNLLEHEWDIFWVGYMAAIKRFGGK